MSSRKSMFSQPYSLCILLEVSGIPSQKKAKKCPICQKYTKVRNHHFADIPKGKRFINPLGYFALRLEKYISHYCTPKLCLYGEKMMIPTIEKISLLCKNPQERLVSYLTMYRYHSIQD